MGLAPCCSESEEPTPHQETVIALGDLSHPCPRHGEALLRQISEFSTLCSQEQGLSRSGPEVRRTLPRRPFVGCLSLTVSDSCVCMPQQSVPGPRRDGKPRGRDRT